MLRVFARFLPAIVLVDPAPEESVYPLGKMRRVWQAGAGRSIIRAGAKGTGTMDMDRLVVGYDIPARRGMFEAEIQTPCLLLDLDALDRNLRRMAGLVARSGLRFRAHGKMHKSVDVAKLQMSIGGAHGVCCQKVSEAEAFVRGGIPDVLVSNEVRDPAKIDRLARLPTLGAEVSVCIDDISNVAQISEAAQRHGTTIGCLVEIDCGGRRCGVQDGPAALEIARAILAAPGLRWEGVQAYNGRIQHIVTPADRAAAFAETEAATRAVVDHLRGSGIEVPLVTGAGTGTHPLEIASGLWTELQCGSYAFMDAEYGRVRATDGHRLEDGHWENALFVLTSVMSTAVPGQAVCDAGLKSQSADAGLPLIHGRTDVRYASWSDEHGNIEDPGNVLTPGQRLRLVPAHCDPTCNLHDWYVGLRGGVVECLWPVSARGKSF